MTRVEAAPSDAQAVARPRAQAAPRRRRLGRRSVGANIVLVVGIVFFMGFTLYPLLYMVSAAFKTQGELYTGFPSLIPQAPTLKNFTDVLFQNSLQQTDIWQNGFNSLAVAVMTIVFTMVVSLPAAFALARGRGLVTTALAGWIRVAQVVGGIVVIIPLYLILREVGLTNTLVGVSLAETIPCSAFATWILITFVRQIPYELEEAARIDGASNWQILRTIILPLIRPGMFSVILLVFLLSWNDFLNPLILINDTSKYTLTVALYTFIGQIGQINWGQLFAFGLLEIVPAVLVIVLAERHLVRGLMAGTGK